jgi:DNA-binding XRE family transcriptional regulator
MLTRDEAIAAGLKRYETGKPCKHGHIAPRFVCTRSCVECVRLFDVKRRPHRYAESKPKMQETFGKRLAKLRKRLKLSQEELAQQARVSARSIWNYEADQKLPHYWQLIELAKQLNTSLDYLCCRTARRRDFI